MNIRTSSASPQSISSDLLVVFAYTRNVKVLLSKQANAIDKALQGALSDMVSRCEFNASVAKHILIHTQRSVSATHVMLVGVGDVTTITMHQWYKVLGSIASVCKTYHIDHMVLAVPDELHKTFDTQRLYNSIAEGLHLGLYEFSKHKNTQTNTYVLKKLTLHTQSSDKCITSSLFCGSVIAKGVALTRDLVNEPPSHMTPRDLVCIAKKIADTHQEITCTVYERKDMESMGMGALLAVARGADQDPAFIHLTYKGKAKKTVTLAGKGITFDTGGYSMKPSKGMETMKLDMAGAATVLGVFHAIGTLKPSITVHGLIAATENVVSARAIKPSDVAVSMSGTSIEIKNTDAEGRLVLADALAYAKKHITSDVIIDIATLTGACVVALGEDVAGIFSNHDNYAEKLLDIAQRHGELMWHMPLPEHYKELLKSDVADISNISKSRYGGAITAALFLQEFVPDSTPWIHMDIAGPAFAEKPGDIWPVGGTGFGVRTLVQFLQHVTKA